MDEESKNEVKVSMSRNYGTEQIAFSASVKNSDKLTEELERIVEAFDKAVYKSFTLTHQREKAENEYIKIHLTPEQLAALEKSKYLPGKRK